MSVRAPSSTDPGRLEPFVVVSLALHVVLLLLFSRLLASQRYVLPMGEGAVVQVIPVPPAPQTAVTTRATAQRSAPGGSGQETSRPARPAAATAVASQPRPATQPKGPGTEAPVGRGQAQAPPASSASGTPARASQELLTSPGSPVTAVTRAAAREELSGQSGEGLRGGQGAQAQGAVARPGGEGTGGVQAGNPPPGPPEPDFSAAVVVPGAGVPQYPKNAVTYGVEGRVVVTVQVGADGRVTAVKVSQSSGNEALDRVASRWVQEQWRFKPSAAGRPYQVSVLFEFAIQRDDQGRAEPRVSFRLLDERVRYL
ncbi:MAG TPA: TonB family protein [Limnochordales bacterium]